MSLSRKTSFAFRYCSRLCRFNSRLYSSKTENTNEITEPGKYSSDKRASKAENTNEVVEEPIKYSTSKAALIKARHTYQAPDPSIYVPPYESHILAISIGIFLLYFCILREENDIDERMKEPLFSAIPKLEYQSLIGAINYNKSKGLPTGDLEKRLQELSEPNEK